MTGYFPSLSFSIDADLEDLSERGNFSLYSLISDLDIYLVVSRKIEPSHNKNSKPKKPSYSIFLYSNIQ